MNRVQQLFAQRKTPLLAIYCTAGYPKLHDTLPMVETLAAAGADLIEIGIPFSDPLADGPTIQNSNTVALANGISVALLFEQLKPLRKRTEIPVLLMGYLNPILQFGLHQFCQKCKETGVDGVIIPDLPLEEYQQSVKSIFMEYNLLPVFLITPKTSEARIKQMDAEQQAFLYLVSAESTTGKRDSLSLAQESYFARIQAMSLRNPILVGFGISTREHFNTASRYAAGAIVGSAFINSLPQRKTFAPAVHRFMQSIRTPSHSTQTTAEKQ